MANEAFIEVNRKGGGKARIRADMITALIEVEPKESERTKPVINVHIGTTTYVTVQDEPMWSLWNKIIQALGGRQITCITKASEEIPGHPKYGKPKAEVLVVNGTRVHEPTPEEVVALMRTSE